MISVQKQMFINLLITISFILTVHLVYGLPILKMFNSINIKKIVNEYIENEYVDVDVDVEHIENEYKNYNEKHNENYNKNYYTKNFDNYDYNSVILEDNYTCNSVVTKHSISFNPITEYFNGEIMLWIYNNIYCIININPPKQISSTYIQNYIYYEFNLGKTINLICNKTECIFKTYYKYTYKFNYFMCDITNQKYINDEL